ncbi:DUF1317 family protein [Pragia fontium]|uniref:DUF1317 family protein n=1 Tax=Pragia fontium TaxID=82985 RepID=UPI000F6DBD89|nr:Protein of uncharacterised function (DUF1317) [Pragia fontium]
MNSAHNSITVGRVTLPYSQISKGWITPEHQVIKNPIKAQYFAEQLNTKLLTQWQQYEKDFIMQVAGEMHINVIAEKLERDIDDIRAMGRGLGLRFDLERYRRKHESSY